MYTVDKKHTLPKFQLISLHCPHPSCVVRHDPRVWVFPSAGRCLQTAEEMSPLPIPDHETIFRIIKLGDFQTTGIAAVLCESNL